MAKAIQSVLAQTFTDYELIIMDDGSKDDSFSIALRAVEGRGNCHLYRQKNAGVSMARNNGVALSQGKFLCFLDADDWWKPTFLEEMSKLIEEYPDAGVYSTSYTIVNETKHKTRVAPIGVEVGFEKGYINYCQVYARTMAMPLTSISVAIPRLVFDEMEGFPQGIKLGEDFLLWIHIALKHKVALLNKPLAYYNQDVDVANRGTNHLYNPKEHMLWNLTDLEPLEETNEDYKQLIDNLRVHSLMPYFMSEQYHVFAQMELAKVNWSKQNAKWGKLYNLPLGILRIRSKVWKLGSLMKRLLSGIK